MGLYRGWRGGGGGACASSFPWIRVRTSIMPLCVSVEFMCLSVCLSVYQSVCLAKSLYMYMPACLHLSLSPPLPHPLSLSVSLSLSLSPSLSLSICGVDLADQRSHARYRVIQVFSLDSKSVPFPINLSSPLY